MTNLTFFTILLENFPLYIVSLLISAIIYGIIMRKIVRSIIDPLFYAMLSGIFAQSVPIFLFLTAAISVQIFVYIILSEIIFWLTYFLTRRKKITFSEYSFSSVRIEIAMYYASFVICVSCYVLTYVLFGIPLFKESRLDTYQNANGLGILSYFQNFTQFFCILYSYYLISQKKHRNLSRIVLIAILIFCLLSGSKSSILIFISCYFFYLYYYKGEGFSLKQNLKYVIPVAIFPLAVIILSTGANFRGAILSFVMRFVANGDCYWMAFPNDVINDVVINNKLEYLFSRILAPFRIINYADVDQAIGVQIDWLVNPDDIGITKGPNSRLPILGWTLFHWGGLLLSCIFGLICSFWHTRLITMFPRGIISVIVFGYIYTSMVAMFTDPLYSTSYVFTFFLFGVFLYFILFIIGGRYIKIKKVS